MGTGSSKQLTQDPCSGDDLDKSKPTHINKCQNQSEVLPELLI